MVLRLFTVLNRKLRAAVQTTQTRRAFFLYPNRLSRLHPNRLLRTVLGTQAAADAAFLHMKMCRPAHGFIRRMAEQPHEVRRGPLHMIAARFHLNLRCHPVDGAFRPLIDPRVSFRIPQIKHRRPGVGKADAVQRVNPHALLLEQVTDFRPGSAGRGAVSRYGKNIILALCGELCVFQKFADRLRQFPGIGRRDDAEPFAARSVVFPSEPVMETARSFSAAARRCAA